MISKGVVQTAALLLKGKGRTSRKYWHLTGVKTLKESFTLSLSNYVKKYVYLPLLAGQYAHDLQKTQGGGGGGGGTRVISFVEKMFKKKKKERKSSCALCLGSTQNIKNVFKINVAL